MVPQATSLARTVRAPQNNAQITSALFHSTYLSCRMHSVCLQFRSICPMVPQCHAKMQIHCIYIALAQSWAFQDRRLCHGHCDNGVFGHKHHHTFLQTNSTRKPPNLCSETSPVLSCLACGLLGWRAVLLPSHMIS